MRNRIALSAPGTFALMVAVFASEPARAQNGPYQYQEVTPCRVVDTRCSVANPPNTSCSGQPPVAAGPANCSTLPACPYNQLGSVAWRLQGSCGLPANARAATVNLTIVQPSARGNARIYLNDSGQTMPIVSTINFAGGENALSNGALVPLASTGAGQPDLRFYLVGASAHVVIDVTGYFCPPSGC
jgi:hypothetical protein